MSEKTVTKGIVLRATATKEADYILNILTDSLGRIAVVARGARRKSSRIAAGCAALQAPDCQCGGRGGLPSPFSGRSKGGILFGKRIPPLATRHPPQINYPLLPKKLLKKSHGLE